MPAVDFTFSGQTKRIIITSGVTDVDVQDMYSRWKNWSQTSDNSKFLQAFRTFGGDPTIAGQFAPRYFFLTNGWRVVVDSNNDVNFATNLYTDELEPPVIVSGDSTASIFNSDAVNVENEVSQTLDYAEHIQINSAIGTSGTTYPVGTAFQPVNNLSDAITIAQERNISELRIFGPIDFDVDLNNAYTIRGGNIRDVVDVKGVNLSGCTFNQCILRGSFNGNVAFDNCLIEDGFSGITNGSVEMLAQHTGLQGKFYLPDNANITMVDCFSQIPGNTSPEVFLGNDISLSMRRYSGGLAIYDCDTGTTVTIEYTAGNCRLLSGNTAGEIEIRGISKLTDQSSGTTVGTDGLLIPIQIAQQHSLNVNTEITRNK
jgi:hypothetical protein